LAGLLVQVLEWAREMKLLKLGTLSLDGTRIQGNASRHSALSSGRIEKIEAQLKAEGQELLALAEEAERTAIPDGASLPEEIKRREDRLPDQATPVMRLAHRLKTKAGRAAYAFRKPTAEPVFGIIESVMGFRPFLLRGLRQVTSEWRLPRFSPLPVRPGHPCRPSGGGENKRLRFVFSLHF
jgi:hypothetical protein